MDRDESVEAGRSRLETLIAYSGDMAAVPTEFDLDLFKRLNREFADKPVVPAPRPHGLDYGLRISRVRCRMLEAKIGVAGMRVLEIGCGASAMSRVLAAEFDCDVVGVDVSHYEEWGRPVEGKLRLMVHDVTAGDNSSLGQFDRIVSFAVLEHVVHPHAAFRAAYELLKPGGRAYIYANLYRGAKASHRYREVYFPWPHLLFPNEVWRQFYLEVTGEALGPAWVNKLTYDQYIALVARAGFRLVEHFPSLPYFDEDFYNRFAVQLAAYPKFDLMHDFIHLVLEKPSDTSGKTYAGEEKTLLNWPPRRKETIASHGASFWRQVSAEEPHWRRFESRWYESRKPGAASIADAAPWVAYPAIEFLEGCLSNRHRVFEWGSGGSTLFFQKRAQQIVSVEHDASWFSRVEALLNGASDQGSCIYRLVEPATSNGETHFGSGAPGCDGKDFEAYVRAIEQFADGSFDLVVVDGRARMACLRAALPKITPGGLLLLDNANYPRYARDLAALRSGALSGWREYDLAGPGPYSRTPAWRTIIWRKPAGPAKTSSEANAETRRAEIARVRRALSVQPLRPYDRISYFPCEMDRNTALAAATGEPFRLVDLEFQLSDAADWDALGEIRSKRLFLQSWNHLEPLFVEHSRSGDAEALGAICRTVFDWIDRFGEDLVRRPPVSSSTYSNSEEATFVATDTAVGNRFYRLAYVIAASAGDVEVGDAEFSRLLELFEWHRRYLCEDKNHAYHHNHGIYQALAQICGADRLLGASRMALAAERARSLDEAILQGRARVHALLERHVSADGVHKEHSPSYHVLVTRALLWAIEAGLVVDGPTKDRVAQMRDAAGWMFDLSGRLANFGDSDLEPPLAPLGGPQKGDVSAAPRPTQLLAEGGYWFVKATTEHGHAYLAQTAAFHSRVHKQADTGAFLWRDRGRDIMIDAGRYGYVGRAEVGSEIFMDGFWYADPRRVYIESTNAHNTLGVDGRNHPRFRARPYGSCLRSATECDGVFASQSSIPNLPGCSHVRLLAFRPGEWLLCVDTIRAAGAKSRRVRQNFQLHPDWSLIQSDGRVARFSVEGGGATLHFSSMFENASIVEHARGKGDPHAELADSLAGWWSPGHLRFEPCQYFALEATGDHVTMASLFSFEPFEIDSDYTSFNVTRRRLRFRWRTRRGAPSISFERPDTNTPYFIANVR